MAKMADGKGVTVLFLGSGASWALGRIPIQDRFLHFILSERDQHEWIDSYRIKVGGETLSKWFLKTGDIELCMSHLHNLGYSSLHKVDDQTRSHAQAAIVTLRTIISKKLKDRIPEKRIKGKFVTWVEKLRSTSTVIFLTTNYDLLLEQTLGEVTVTCPDVFGVNGNSQADSRRCVYKLHGSINWLETKPENGSQRIVDRQELSRRLQKVDLKAKSKSGCPSWGWGYEVDRDNTRIDVPIMVPFFFQKAEWIEDGRWKDIFLKHWKSAFDVITETRKLEAFYFIGYGMPAADSYMMSWVLNILNKSSAKEGTVKIVCKGEPGNLGKVMKPFINPRKDIYECGLEHFLEGHAGL